MLGAMAEFVEKKPFIVTEHGIYSREREEELLRATWVAPYFKKMWISLFYMLARVGYEYAVSVTALFKRANTIQAELGCDQGKLKVIQNGIRYERFINIPLKAPDGYVDIGAIVRFHPIKDIKTMIYSFFELKSKVPQARLHILGDTDDEEYKQECLQLIEQLQIQDIIIPGSVNTVEYLEKLDFTILTSISEGQPLSVLESFAARRPCVVTDVGCCRQLVEGNDIDYMGAAGICTMPMHSQAIASAMEFLATREKARIEMGEIAQKRVIQRYTHKKMIQNYLDTYTEVLSNGGNRV
jgi:glycosyltransferase involved in cell wall biosynthesis